ncbi:MAG: protein translocase subunit SecF [Actinomycetota bacterium]
MAGGFKRLMAGQTNIDFIGRSKLWATISGVVIGVSLIALITPGLSLSLEFRGGTALTVPIATSVGEVTVTEVEEALAEHELEEQQIQLQRGGGGVQQVQVRSARIAPSDLEAVRISLAELAGQQEEDGTPAFGTVNVNDVGPSWGRQISTKALRGLIVFLFLVTIYISFRFEPKMAAGAILALFHDLIATAGIYSLTGLPVSPATVIALLALMGYSLYDTVVVFDRVTENSAAMARNESYGRMVNRSINEVLVRSVNTSVSSILPVAGLLFVGVFLFNADTLKDLAVAMFVGTAVSIYSSIFVAAPVLATLKELEPRYKALKGRTEKVAVGASEEEPASTQPTTSSGRPIRPRRPRGKR